MISFRRCLSESGCSGVAILPIHVEHIEGWTDARYSSSVFGCLPRDTLVHLVVEGTILHTGFTSGRQRSRRTDVAVAAPLNVSCYGRSLFYFVPARDEYV